MNPAAGARRLVARVAANYEAEVSEIDSWTLAEGELLLSLAREHESYLFAPLLFLLHTGVRRGEVLGLQWRKVDFERSQASIVRSRVRTSSTMSVQSR